MSGDVHPLDAVAAPDLHQSIRAALALMLDRDDPLAARLGRSLPPGVPPRALAEAALARSEGPDGPLLAACRGLGLGRAELIAAALAAGVERDATLPAVLRRLQGDDFGPWPSLATLARVLGILLPDTEDETATLPDLSRAAALGLITRIGDRMPAAEDRFALTPPVLAALGLSGAGMPVEALCPGIEAPPAWIAAAATLAEGLADRTVLVLRSGDTGDGRLYASILASALGRVAVLRGDQPGFGVAARLAGWLPVDLVATQSGQRSTLAPLPGFDGPRLVLANREGGLRVEDRTCRDLTLPPLPPEERRVLWRAGLGVELGAEAVQLGRLRIGPARLAAVAARAAAAEGALKHRLRAAMGAEIRPDLEPHAALVPQDVADTDFVADEALRADLAVLLARCRYRASGAPNPIPGVRALLSGPSGTGKTLAASWLATELGLPLFKIDLSSVVSKYIGETEENLARILDRAEDGDLALLMDEADSLFSARTETKDSSDRYANNQTNYLLSRIEAFDGIALLTSNGPERFDTAFARRLDQVIQVPLPSARDRRRIWRLHLGQAPLAGDVDFNRLAGLVDLAGGHIRNIAHTARVLAAAGDRPIAMTDLAIGIAQEYRKLGRAVPGGLDA